MSLKRQGRCPLGEARNKRKQKLDFVREPVEQVTERISDKLVSFGAEYKQMSLRQQVLCLANIAIDIRNSLNKNVMDLSGLGEMSASDRELAYLKMHVRTPISTEEMRVVGGIEDHQRRIRELRGDRYEIGTSYTVPSLAIGEYMLMDINPSGPPRESDVPEAVRRVVFARDNYTCRNPNCRWNEGLQGVMGFRYLVPHHLITVEDYGPNVPDNLILVCGGPGVVCHAKIHSKMLNPFLWLDADTLKRVEEIRKNLMGEGE